MIQSVVAVYIPLYACDLPFLLVYPSLFGGNVLRLFFERNKK